MVVEADTIAGVAICLDEPLPDRNYPSYNIFPTRMPTLWMRAWSQEHSPGGHTGFSFFLSVAFFMKQSPAHTTLRLSNYGLSPVRSPSRRSRTPQLFVEVASSSSAMLRCLLTTDIRPPDSHESRIKLERSL